MASSNFFENAFVWLGTLVSFIWVSRYPEAGEKMGLVGKASLERGEEEEEYLG